VVSKTALVDLVVVMKLSKDMAVSAKSAPVVRDSANKAVLRRMISDLNRGHSF
jgi:hypothetical protein